MKNIILVCVAGMSTSLLVNKMKAAAREENRDANIEAMPIDLFSAYKEPVDVLLLGPQVSYMEQKMREEYEPQGIKVGVINISDYGMMNGKKVLQDAYCLMN